MFKFLWKIRSAYGHARGLFALYDGRLSDAEHFLRQGILAGERAQSPLIGETYLLLSATLGKLRRRTQAIELFWTGIGEIQQSPTYSTHDVNYLGAYFCQLWRLLIATGSDGSTSLQFVGHLEGTSRCPRVKLI
jgi:hypothetical protein